MLARNALLKPLRPLVSSQLAGQAAGQPACVLLFSRGLAGKKKKPKKRSKGKGNTEEDLGWDVLREDLLAVPCEMPNLKALTIFHSNGAGGPGHAGSRKFWKQHHGHLKYQNPDAQIKCIGDQPPTLRGEKQQRSRERTTPTLTIELHSGEQHGGAGQGGEEA